MAEQKAEKKKLATVGRILKWIGVGCLALIVIAAVLFRAPWKVIALLLVFLCACTVLPKPARKWFWAGVGVVILALIIWVFLPDDSEGWRPYTFDEELADLEAKYAIPDSENAAIIYNKLLADNAKYKKREQKEEDKLIAEALEKGTVSIPVEDVNDINDLFSFSYSTFYPDFWYSELDYLTQRETWSSKEHPRVAEWLREREDTTAMLLEASRKQMCSFPIPPDAMSLQSSMARFGPMRRWATFLIRGANNDLGDGRVTEAMQKNFAVLQMAKHECQQPLLLDFLVGQAIERIALENVKRLVVEEDLTGKHLNLIKNTVAKVEHNWRSDFLRILECEKMMGKNTLTKLLFEINQHGKIRRARSPAVTGTYQDANDISKVTFWEKKLWKARTIIGWFLMPSDPQDLTEIFDSAYERLSAMAEEDFDWEKKPQKISLGSIEFNYRFLVDSAMVVAEYSMHMFHDQYLRTITNQRGAVLIVELKRYKKETGHWPQSLDDIKSFGPPEIFIDAINGNSFIYKLQGDSFKLYSKGKNNLDEDGERYSYDDGSGPDDFLIWPPRGRRIEQENANAE